MQYEELKQKIKNRQKREVPYDVLLNCQELRYQYDTVKKQGMLLTKNNKHQPLYINQWAHQQLLTKLVVPNAYIGKCPPELKEENINHFLSKTDKLWKYRVINDNLIRAVVSDSYVAIDDLKLIDLIEPFLKNRDIGIMNYHVSDVMTSIRFVFDEVKGKHNVDDIVKKGVVINNSEVGFMALQFRAYLYRLVCENGLISPKNVGGAHFRHRGDELRIMNACASTIVDITNGLDGFYNNFQKMKQFEILEPMTYIEDTCKAQKWPNSWKDYFIKAYTKEPVLSMYGIVNAFSRGAQRLQLHDRTKIEEFAANLAVKLAN